MGHSISGNAGVAGATFFWFSVNTFLYGSVIADALGNYNTGEVLEDDTYRIQTSKLGYSTTPVPFNQTISGTNVGGVDFTAHPLSASISFTRLTNDDFQRADEVPLNTAVWRNAFGSDQLQIINQECVITQFPTNEEADSDSSNIAIDWTSIPDQWCEVKITHLNNGAITLYLRNGSTDSQLSTFPTYRLSVSSVPNDGNLIPGWFMDQLNDVPVIVYSWVDAENPLYQEFKVGDVVRFGVKGGATGHLYAFLNGSLLGVGSIADAISSGAPLIESGLTGMQLDSGAFPNSSQTLSDVGVVNFIGGSIGTMPIYTQLAVDTFQRANENPLNPANWTTALGGYSASLLASHLCECADIGIGESWSNWTSASFPNGQYVEGTVGALDPDGELAVIVRASTSIANQGYSLSTFNGTLILSEFPSTILQSAPLVVNIGDVLRLEAFGTTLTAKVNGTVILTASSGTFVSGVPGLLIFPSADITDTAFSSFAAGSITQSNTAYSIPDDRNYGNFPNDSRNVQGTLTYDVPSVFSLRWWFDTLFNRTQPLPVDSRKVGAPVDSRVSSIIPENSRVTPS